jgi:tRNA-specific 2-thiouridylase
MARRVIVAMSGGVDSSVAAALLAEQGDEVIGVGLRFPDATGSGTCCGMAGMEDARRVAGVLDIPFYVLDYRDVFEREVIEPFCRSYLRGETPNPCILCNVRLKFGGLLQAALALGAGRVATGHYARRASGPERGEPWLLRGLDRDHDQSYFLYALTPHQLAHALFPVGELTKPQVRAIAARLGLAVADKPGSQDICFVGEEGYRAFVSAREPDGLLPGPIMDGAEHVLGQHSGLAGYTLGQRKGLRIAAPEPLYVIGLDAERNAVIVGARHELLSARIEVEGLNWLGDETPVGERRLTVRTRYHGPDSPALVTIQGERAQVIWDAPRPRVAPGQAVVFFDRDRVLGGGTARAAADGGQTD